MSFTQADLIAMQARLDRNKPRNERAPGGDEGKEAHLHNAIIAHCKNVGWIYFHGSMAGRTYRTIGENDFHCLLPNGIVLFIECKTKQGKLTPEQLGMKLWMEKLGHTMHIVRSFQEFTEIATSALMEKGLGNSKSYPSQKINMEEQLGSASVHVEEKQ